MAKLPPDWLAGLTLACGFRPAAVQAFASDPAAVADPFGPGRVSMLVPVPAGCAEVVEADPKLAATVAAGAVLILAFEDAADLARCKTPRRLESIGMNPRNNPMHRRPSSRLLAVAAAAQAPIAPRPVELLHGGKQGEGMLKNDEIQNATQAAIRAGYSEKTARQVGEENLSKPDIREALSEAMRVRSQRTEVTARASRPVSNLDEVTK